MKKPNKSIIVQFLTLILLFLLSTMPAYAYENARVFCMCEAGYTKIADYARLPMAFCYQQGILDDSALNVEPNKVITRAEVVEMLCNMLSAAKRL